MRFQVTPQYLAHTFPGLPLNHEKLVNQLNLDLGHLQLLRDCYQTWEPQEQRFWMLLLALIDAVNQGSLCLDLKQQTVNNQLQAIGLTQALSLAEEHQWQQFQLNQQVIIILDKGCLYLNKYWQLECQLQTALERLLDQYSGQRFNPSEVSIAAKQVTDELNFAQIEDRQILAITVSLLQPFSIISGGPGTGKTTIMSSVLRGLMLLGYQPQDVLLAAPTGRAANRMTESLHEVLNQHIKVPAISDEALKSVEAKTIHRLLGARAEWRGFQYGKHNPLNCKILVVDEVSMVDVAMMRQLLQAIPLDCRVILLGDQYQLPSVDSGAVLADLMPTIGTADQYSQAMWQDLSVALEKCTCKTKILKQINAVDKAFVLTDHVAVLSVSKRNQRDIAQVSEMVRQGDSEKTINSALIKNIDDPDNWGHADQSGVYYIPALSDHKAWQHGYINWLKYHYFNPLTEFKSLLTALVDLDETELQQYQSKLDQVFAVISSNRILTLVNETSVGSQQINAEVVEMMKRELGVSGTQNQFHGSVIMMGENNAALDLFNGDVAILLATSQGQLRAVMPHKGGYRSHSIHVLPRFSSAYAITVHKSQGSEFKHVLMPLPLDEKHRLLTREIIYTGMTRAKQSVSIYAEQAALKAAISRQTTRHSGLNLWS